MRAFALVLALAIGAGCGDKKERPRADPAPPIGGLALDPPRTYRIGDGTVQVDVTLRPPAGWIDQSTGDKISLNTRQGSWLKIALTCHGTCGDAAQLGANIATVARQRFDFLTDSAHVPKLAPVWDQEVTEAAPGVYRYAFHGKAADGDRPDWEEHYVVVDRLVGGRVLDCSAEPVTAELGAKADLVRLCDELIVAVVGGAPTATPDAGAPAAPPDAAAAPAAVTLTYLPPRAGDTWTDREDTEMILDNGAFKLTTHLRRQVEVLEASPQAVVKARYSYPELEKRFEQNGQTAGDPSPLVGKSYLLDASGSGVAITAADGSPVSQVEIDEIKDEEESFGQSEGIERLICSQSYRPGEPVALPPPALLAAQPLDETPITGMTLTLQEVSGGVARFAVEMRAQSGMAKAIDMSLRGELKLDAATCAALRLEADGQVTISGKRGTVKLDMERTR